jgi:hypothetical protein
MLLRTLFYLWPSRINSSSTRFRDRMGGGEKTIFKEKVISKRFWFIALAIIAITSVIGYAAVTNYVLNIPSNVAVVSADPALQLIASDNSTVITSISFGNIPQGETGTWRGYLNNTGNVDLHTFSIASSDLGPIGTISWNMPASGDLGVGQLYPITITLTINQTASLGSHGFTIQITGSPTGPTVTTVQIYASDPNDGYPRTWDVVFDRPMPPFAPGGDHVGSDVDEAHYSGDTMTFQWNLAGGAHYLIFAVTQTGGPNYGVYSGTITINGNTYNFSGLDADHTVTIDFTV